METFLDLEDRNGLVCIDCGDEVRILIPMSTHPVWRRTGGIGGSRRRRSSRHSDMIPLLSSSVLEVACLMRYRHRRHAATLTSRTLPQIDENTEGERLTHAQKIVWYCACGFVTLAMVYPYLMIIFITVSQIALLKHSQHEEKAAGTSAVEYSSSLGSTALLLISTIAVVIWNSRTRRRVYIEA